MELAGHGYRQLAEELTTYVVDNGFTHVELLPPAEHPYGGSWGYQVSGYFAPSSRFGAPDDFRHLVEAIHAYTHELTGAPIRDGLHTLGHIPTCDQLVELEEAFLASTTREVQPVSAIDGRALPAVPGGYTATAAERLRRRIEAS